MTLIGGYLIESALISILYLCGIFCFYKIRSKSRNRRLKYLLIGSVIGLIGKAQRFAIANLGVELYGSIFTVHWIDIIFTSIAMTLIAIAIVGFTKSN